MTETIQISEDDIRQLLGMVEGLTLRLEQIERLLSLRLKTKLMVVGKDDGRGAAELLEGIREGVQIETILLDIGGRLHDLEFHCFASETDKAAVGQLLAGLSEEQQDDPVGASDNDAADGGEDAAPPNNQEVVGDESDAPAEGAWDDEGGNPGLHSV